MTAHRKLALAEEARLRDAIRSALAGPALRIRPVTGTVDQLSSAVWRLFNSMRDSGELPFDGPGLSVLTDPASPGTLILARRNNP